MKFAALALTMLSMTFAAAPGFAKPSIKMICNLSVSDGSVRTEFLTQRVFNTDEAVVEIFGAKGEVPPGYEGYGAVVTNSSLGMVVVMIDQGKSIGSKVVRYEDTEFKISRSIDNLKFQSLDLDCGTAL